MSTLPTLLIVGDEVRSLESPGSSNKRFRSWFAPLTQSNLIRYRAEQSSAYLAV